MVFVINGLKYDTDKMEKIAEVEKAYPVGGMTQRVAENLYGIRHTILHDEDCTLWRSKAGRWLLTHSEAGYACGEAIEEREAKELLMTQAHGKYEEIYGELPEA